MSEWAPQLIKQTKKGECGPACLAMVLGLHLDEVLADFPECHTKGMTDWEMAEYLIKNGQPALPSMEWPTMAVPVIATVPSLNHPGLLHYVLWTGSEWLDPTNEELRYPDDAPEGLRCKAGVSWATVILLWLPVEEGR